MQTTKITYTLTISPKGEALNIPENKYLGKLCSRGHDFENTGKSLRNKKRWECTRCLSIKKMAYHKKYPEKKEAIDKAYRIRNLAKIMERHKLDRENNLTRYRRYERESAHRGVIALSDAYVKRLATKNSLLATKDVPPELIHAKRELLKLKRDLRRAT